MYTRTIVFDLLLKPSFTPIDEADREIHGRLLFSVADPFAVRLQFIKDGAVTRRWKFDREVLVEGLYMESGLGSPVVISPHATADNWIALMLTQDDSYPFYVHAGRGELSDFVDLMTYMLPLGSEPVGDMDAELSALLGGGS